MRRTINYINLSQSRLQRCKLTQATIFHFVIKRLRWHSFGIGDGVDSTSVELRPIFTEADLKKRINFRLQSARKKFIHFFPSVNDESTNVNAADLLLKFFKWLAGNEHENIRYK